LSQANIEDTFLDIDINQLMLPEEVHLRGMTVFSKSKKYCGEYDRNICTKNEVCIIFYQVLLSKMNLQGFFNILCIKRNLNF